MKKYFALSAIGQDRPGIVAEVAGLIYECGGNLEDSSMTILGNQFALLILISGSGEDFFLRLTLGCKRLEWEKHLSILLTPLGEMVTVAKPPEFWDIYELTTIGLDRMGIVYHISRLLADKNINIIDLHTKTNPSPESGTPLFTMKMLIQVPKEISADLLRQELNILGEKLAIDISLKKV